MGMVASVTVWGGGRGVCGGGDGGALSKLLSTTSVLTVEGGDDGRRWEGRGGVGVVVCWCVVGWWLRCAIFRCFPLKTTVLRIDDGDGRRKGQREREVRQCHPSTHVFGVVSLPCSYILQFHRRPPASPSPAHLTFARSQRRL